jgi:hypothetical protein
MDILTQEESLVAELNLLGIRYLSRQTPYSANRVRSGKRLLVDLIRQTSSRVRTAVISVFLVHPEYVHALPLAVQELDNSEQLTLKLFYTAAVLLQRKYVQRLEPFLSGRWQWLPDLYSKELGLPAGLKTDDQLTLLGIIHQEKLGSHLNWTGTYENTVQHLIRRLELEKRWN